MISADVGPFLRTRGFDASGSSFEPERGPLYDMINFQDDWHNGTMSWHGFFINVGIGSVEIDTACPGYDRVGHPLKGSLLQHRWEHLVPDLPYEVRFDHRTDMRQLAAALCDGFDLALAEIERISTTDDIDTLTEYVTTLHNCFGRQDRWSIFDRNISMAVGRWAWVLRERGVLDPN